MPGTQIDKLLDICAASLLQVQAGAELLFTSHKDLYKSIDDSCLGDIKWNSFQVKYSGPQPNGNILPWMNSTYDVFHHNPREVVHQILANPDLAIQLNLAPYWEYDSMTNEQCWCDFMSAD